MPVKYELTEEERKVILREANRRQSVNEAKKIAGRNGAAAIGGKALFYHKIGAAGEWVIASYLGLRSSIFSEFIPVRGSSDLPFRIDVKTRSRHYYDLVVQLDDTGDKVYWLVTIEKKEILIHGWIHAKDCKKDEYIKDPAGGRKAYFIPKSKLSSPESFKTEVDLLTRGSEAPYGM
jgi:hypothetical protein